MFRKKTTSFCYFPFGLVSARHVQNTFYNIIAHLYGWRYMSVTKMQSPVLFLSIEPLRPFHHFNPPSAAFPWPTQIRRTRPADRISRKSPPASPAAGRRSGGGRAPFMPAWPPWEPHLLSPHQRRRCGRQCPDRPSTRCAQCPLCHSTPAAECGALVMTGRHAFRARSREVLVAGGSSLWPFRRRWRARSAPVISPGRPPSSLGGRRLRGGAGSSSGIIDPVYMSRKIRKFRTDKFDTWNKRKFWLMQLM